MVQHDLCVGAQDTTARRRQAGSGKREAKCVSLHVTTNRHQHYFVRKKAMASSIETATSGGTTRNTTLRGSVRATRGVFTLC